jgi:DNA modification methylase
MNKNNFRLICGDAVDVISQLTVKKDGIHSVDMIFCSPNPLFYHMKQHNVTGIGTENTLIEYLFDLSLVFTRCYDLLKDTGSLWVHMMDTYMMGGSMIQVPERFSLMMVGKRWKLRGKRVWLRGPHEITKGSTAAQRLCPWDWEPIFHFTKQAEDYVFNADSPFARTSVITGAPYLEGVSGLPHKVMIECMDLTTREGDTVLDCFMGTGETGLAALGMGRKFIGIDISAQKVKLASQRLRSLK